MTEYIKREAAIRVTCMGCCEEGNCNERCVDIARLIEIPAADVKPVVRGEWIPKNADGSWRVDTCSACKKDTHYVRYAPAYDFCPNCGADMREVQG